MSNSSNLCNIALLGSTGTIGVQCLDVVRRNKNLFRVVSLAAGKNIKLLQEQIAEFNPISVVVSQETEAIELQALLGKKVEVGFGVVGLNTAVSLPEVHTVVGAIVGFACLEPVLTAIAHGKHLALANKECLVAGGSLVLNALKSSPSILVPVDSEHSSIFQCIKRRNRDESIRRIILTASGGPFLYLPLEKLREVTPNDAIRHPRWNMGKKISVDSATLMNKGLEVIEAAVLFQLQRKQIEVLIHPQSIVHGFVEYYDGNVLAALFEADMRIPLSYALSYLSGVEASTDMNYVSSGVGFLQLQDKEPLTFLEPDLKRFPALGLCLSVLEIGDSSTAVLNAANEVAVEAFLQGRVGFTQIVQIVEETLAKSDIQVVENIEHLYAIDARARTFASNYIEQGLKNIRGLN